MEKEYYKVGRVPEPGTIWDDFDETTKLVYRTIVKDFLTSNPTVGEYYQQNESICSLREDNSVIVAMRIKEKVLAINIKEEHYS